MAQATIGILSPGDMGAAVAKLLQAEGFKTVTNVSGRSQGTQSRARANGIELLLTDVELCNRADVVLSIVPPRDAIATAQRIVQACSSTECTASGLVYVDLNAVSPATTREIAEMLANGPRGMRFVDGGIIGAPPRCVDGVWTKPSIPVSGPVSLTDLHPAGTQLVSVLNIKHINGTIGSASGLKMCFASLSKGFTALAIQSFSAAQSLGVLDELKVELDQLSPGTRTKAEKGLVSMPPKAYRWVEEMRYIARTFEEAGFNSEESPFRSIAELYALIADGTVLGQEKTEDRQRGKTADDVSSIIASSLEERKSKLD